MPGPFAVILSKPEDPPANNLAQALAKFHGFTAFDGQRMAKHAWGFLGDKLSEEDAKRLQETARAQGLETFLLDEKDLPAVPAAQTLHRARLDDDGLHYWLGTDPTERLFAWDKVGLLSAVGLREETSFVKTIHQGPTPEQRLMSAGIMMATG